MTSVFKLFGGYMPRYMIILCALVLVVGCSSGPGQGIADNPANNENIDHDRFGWGGGEGEDEGTGSGTTSNEPDQVIPVQIGKSTNNFGKCVFDEECEKPFKVKGGTGKYILEITGLPSGLTWEKFDDSDKKFRITGKPKELGLFDNIKVIARDEINEDNRDERTFTLNVEEDIVINVYKNGMDLWELIDDEEINIPADESLKIEAIGHASEYKWAFCGNPVVCDNVGNCEAECNGLVLSNQGDARYSSSVDHKIIGTYLKRRIEHIKLGIQSGAGVGVEKKTLMFLSVKPESAGQEFKNVKIEVEDNFGNKDFVTLSSVKFEKDPCSTPLEIDSDSSKTIEAFLGDSFREKLEVSGGVPPYTWQVESILNYYMLCNDTWEISETEGGGILSGRFKYNCHPVGSLTDILTVTVTDSCSNANAATVTRTFNVDYPVEKASELTAFINLGANDTDNSGTSKMQIQLLDEDHNIVFDSTPIDLDRYGDNNNSSWGDDTSSNHGLRVELAVKDDQPVDINSLRFVRLNFPSTGSDFFENLDVEIYGLKIEGNYWFAEYGGQGEKEFGSSSADWIFRDPIEWKKRPTPDYD